MSDSSSVSDGVRSDDGSSPRVAIKGGAGGVAAIIRAQKQQSGGLRELGKTPITRDTRAKKTMSTMVEGSSGLSGVNPSKCVEWTPSNLNPWSEATPEFLSEPPLI